MILFHKRSPMPTTQSGQNVLELPCTYEEEIISANHQSQAIAAREPIGARGQLTITAQLSMCRSLNTKV
jgi:hypothetical protein